MAQRVKNLLAIQESWGQSTESAQDRLLGTGALTAACGGGAGAIDRAPHAEREPGAGAGQGPVRAAEAEAYNVVRKLPRQHPVLLETTIGFSHQEVLGKVLEESPFSRMVGTKPDNRSQGAQWGMRRLR